MSVIDATARELLAHTEFLTIVTEGPDGPHLVGNWLTADIWRPPPGIALRPGADSRHLRKRSLAKVPTARNGRRGLRVVRR